MNERERDRYSYMDVLLWIFCIISYIDTLLHYMSVIEQYRLRMLAFANFPQMHKNRRSTCRDNGALHFLGI